MADNSVLKATTPGIGFYFSRRLQALDRHKPPVSWGDSVAGIDEKHGWLTTVSKEGIRYMPTTLDSSHMTNAVPVFIQRACFIARVQRPDPRRLVGRGVAAARAESADSWDCEASPPRDELTSKRAPAVVIPVSAPAAINRGK